MGNISGQDELVTKKDLADFYKFLLPYLGSGNSSSSDPVNNSITTVSGYTPLGTIISYYGETAPRFYLTCDGSEYNKSDYPELANHLLSLTNHSQYEVSGDNTKFKVPDLRGEFLRGTGINSHENQGSGGSVGEHQDGTVIPTPFINDNRGGYATDSNGTINGISNSDINVIKKSDNSIVSDGSITLERRNWSISSTTTSVTNNASIPRPTNTSVLYCIAYKDIYTNPMNDYSTEEKVVGTWTDGKPIYQKTVVITLPSSSGEFDISQYSNLPFGDMDTLIECKGYANRSDGWLCPVNYRYDDSMWFLLDWRKSAGKIYFAIGTLVVGQQARLTFIYTKTTD